MESDPLSYGTQVITMYNMQITQGTIIGTLQHEECMRIDTW